MKHEKTLQNFVTMVERFGSFTISPDSARELVTAIHDLQSRNRNLTTRNQLLRNRPDLTIHRVKGHDELVRLQALESRLMFEDGTYEGELNGDAIARLRTAGPMAVTPEQFDSLCELAAHSAETYTDPKTGKWYPPTAYAYAKACEALHAQRNTNRGMVMSLEQLLEVLREKTK